MKPIVIFAFIAIACFGYYAWKQQQRSFAELKKLESSGVTLSVTVIARPLVAVDAIERKIHLAYPDKTIALPLRTIQRIEFIEARVNNQRDSQPVGPDTMTIHTTDNRQYNITDLRTDAAVYYRQFVDVIPTTDIALKRR